jgi:hypothetical protein
MRKHLINLLIAIVIIFSACVKSQGSLVADETAKSEIRNYFSNISTVTNIVELNKALLTAVWSPSFDTPLSSLSKGQLKGKLLPVEIVASAVVKGEARELQHQLFSNLTAGTNPLIATQSEVNAYTGLSAVISDVFNNSVSSSLPKLLESRGKELPPTKGDLVIFRIMVTMDRMPDPFESLTDQSMQSWIDLAGSRNSIYRLIAAQAFHKLVSNPQELTLFYSEYASESDPYICSIIIDIINNSNQKYFIPTLQNIQNQQSILGHTDVAAHASLVIQNLTASGL